jgi:type VI secretion system protein ImpL
VNTVFLASLVLAAIALVLTALLLWRARRVKVPVAPAAKVTSWRWVDLRERLRATWAVLERAVRYVLARRDWRYRSSWLLLMGLPGDGKSSLSASIPPSLLRRPQRRDAGQEAYLSSAVPNSRWTFLEQGVLIDPDASLCSTAADVAVDRRWHAMLHDIDSLRPDRALDGIVWVISARRLLAGDEAQLLALARYAFMRINDVQEQFAFALPVYVVVSQCDAVDGFDAFWGAQDPALRRQMVGWSSPTIDDNGLPGEWVDKTFAKLIEGLRALALSSASTHDHIDDVDGFFLFPQHMRSLQPALKRFLEVVFKPNVYETRAFCRGLYFTGANASTKVAAGTPRNDVSFVEGLMRDKVFAEQRLAQRTQKGLLLRNRLVRNLQLGVVAVSLILAMALPWTASHVGTQAQALRDTVVAVSVSSKSLGQRGCLDQDQVYGLVNQIAALDTRTRYVVIPLSWVDRRLTRGVSNVVSANALRLVVMPSLACHLQKRIDDLSIATLDNAEKDTADTAARKVQMQLTRQLTDLAGLEDNLERFSHIAEPGMHGEQKALLQDFATLATYVYGKAPPASTLHEGSALNEALVEVTYPDAPKITPAMRQRLGERFERMAEQARVDLLARIDSGVPLLASLKENKPPVLDTLRAFNGWLAWVRGAWMLSTPGDNPCSRLGNAISPGIEALIKGNHYDTGLRTALYQFDTATCYQPAVDGLRRATLPPYGALFEVNATTHVLDGVNPGLQSEATGLKALADVGFMQVKTPQALSCNGQIDGWRTGTFDELLSELREYQLFASWQKLAPMGPPPSGDPLYDQLARTQLQLALADSLARNQRKASDTTTDPGLDAVSQLDRKLSSESANMSAALGSLLQALQQSRQMRLDTVANSIGQCARNYASGMLLDASGLASASQLYAPASLEGDADDAPVFDLGSTPVLQAYLDRQLQRMQVLSGYAAPFVSLLKNSQGVDGPRQNAQTDTYWDNTIGELNSAIQFSETSGQVARLNDFFLKQMAPMTFGGCNAMLDAYKSPAAGNDFFSIRRQDMEKTAGMACAGHGKTSSNMHFYRIAMLFNSEMAGRYPFGGLNSQDVSPATMKAFFVYYAKEKPGLASWLASAKGADADRMRAFIGQIDAVQAFLAGSLLAQPQAAPVDLEVGFRAPPDDSPLTNQLVAMTVAAGDGKLAWPGAGNTLPWSSGQSLSVDLQWANRSRDTPLPDPAQADLGVSGYHAVFNADGPWALLRLMAMHKPTAAATNVLDPALQLLEFQVPVLQAPLGTGQASSDRARVYLTVKAYANDPTTKARTALVVPSFPQQAPVP